MIEPIGNCSVVMTDGAKARPTLAGARGVSASDRRLRLAILASHPIQYQTPLFRVLSDCGELEVTVYFCWDASGQVDPEFGRAITWDIPLLDGYRYRYLRNLSPWPRPSFFGQINPGIVRHLRRGRYDGLLLHGYATATAWLTLLGARFARTPVLFRGESDLVGPRSGWCDRGKRLVLAGLFRHIDAFLYSYSANADFYRHYGVPESKLFFCPSAVDNSAWRQRAREWLPRKCQAKQMLGIPVDSPTVLFVGKLMLRKRPFDLLSAFERIGEGSHASLIFAGDGALRGELETQVQERHVPRVIFTGFRNQSELPSIYAAADVLALPSEHDPSPKVLHEAMNFGLPLVVSAGVATASDVVQTGKNGVIYPVGDVGALADALATVLRDPETWRRMGQVSREIVSSWSFEADVAAVVEALRQVSTERR
jgi:glycosyltransferase involved in cell wall biosynthesis